MYVHHLRGDYDPEGDPLIAGEGPQARLRCRYRGQQLRARPGGAVPGGTGAAAGRYQVEYHPLFRPEDRLEHAREQGYPLVAYSPLSGGRVGDVDEVVAVAEKHGISPEQASLAWLLAKGIYPIPKAFS